MLKKISLTILIVILILTIFFLLIFREEIKSLYLKSKLNKWEKKITKYSLDQKGGNTPEETYQMFKQALEKEDIEKAAALFHPHIQDEWRAYLNKAKKEKQLKEMLNDLGELKKTKIEDKRAEYYLDNNISHTIIFEKNLNNIWKISFL